MSDYLTTADIMEITGLTRGAVNRYSSGDPRYKPTLKVAKVNLYGRRENLYSRQTFEAWLEEWKAKKHSAGRPRKGISEDVKNG